MLINNVIVKNHGFPGKNKTKILINKMIVLLSKRRNKKNKHPETFVFEGPKCPTVTMVQMDRLSSFWTASRVRPFSNKVHSHTSTSAFAGHLSPFGWCPSAIHFDKCTRTGHSALAEKVRISNRADYKALLLCWWMIVGKWTLAAYQWIIRGRFWHAESSTCKIVRKRQPLEVKSPHDVLRRWVSVGQRKVKGC